ATHFHSGEAHRCLIIQPYVKWGPHKLKISTEEQLEEAVALVETLPSWKVEDTISVPLDTLDRKTLFKSGSMDRLEKVIHRNHNITAVFINIGNLARVTTSILQENFGVPILDRYKIVMQILKMHATSKHAKLQVALAELYYIKRKSERNLMFFTHNTEALKLMFDSREKKLKNAIQDLRNQRMMLRNRRKQMDFPIIAVVGYTNAGKTCLIKALTGEDSLQPRNQLFATLDVTLHAGILPSGLEVLYVDTDIILHVEDLSSSCFEYKRNHVITTLKELGVQTGNENIMDKVVNIGNKCDLVDKVKDLVNDLDILVSAKKGIGLDTLRYHLEKNILEATSRHKITIKVLNGGDEIRWLYKNATVIAEMPDETDTQYINAKVIIAHSNLQKFKHHFISQ
ncbi:hypothetical protein NQ314_007915, partial [Rhamnusium bicolor]